MNKRRVFLSCGPQMLSEAHIEELKNIFFLLPFHCAVTQSYLTEEIKRNEMEGLILGGMEHINREVAERVSGTLEWIAFLGDQENTFIDVNACQENGIQVFKTGGGARSVAQKTFKQITDADRIRNWYAKQLKSISGSDREVSALIRDRKICVVGAGRIGQAVMRKLKRLMRSGKGEIVYTGGRGEKPELEKEGFKYVKYLEEAFDADAVSVHLSYIPSVTENIITPDILARIRRNGLLINNARAELVNPYGLLKFLEIRHDVNCIFDVFWEEGAEFENLGRQNILSQLIDLPNFDYTQHSAALHRLEWTQEEYWTGLQRIIAEKNLA